jgi:hypothetical protein
MLPGVAASRSIGVLRTSELPVSRILFKVLKWFGLLVVCLILLLGCGCFTAEPDPDMYLANQADR